MSIEFMPITPRASPQSQILAHPSFTKAEILARRGPRKAGRRTCDVDTVD